MGIAGLNEVKWIFLFRDFRGLYYATVDDDSQRGDTACGVSRTYLIREPFTLEHQGKAYSEECTLGNAGVLA